MTTTLNNSMITVGIKAYYNDEKNIIEVQLSSQIKRHFIGVIDAMVRKIIGDIDLRIKFSGKPSGEFLGEEKIKIPCYGIWTQEDQNKARKENEYARKEFIQRTSPTSVGQNAKIIKINE